MIRDPGVQALLDHVIASSRPLSMTLPLPEGRKNYDELCVSLAAPEQIGETEDSAIDIASGSIPVRIYRPTKSDLADDSDRLPVVTYFHGGGWVFGGLESHDSVCRALSQRSGCVVVAAHYRLAPEHPFPAPFEDCLAVVKEIGAEGAVIGADPTRIAVAGDSSGANLAAATALAVKEVGPRLSAALLYYPALDPRMSSVSYEENAEDPFLSRAEMAWYWASYLGNSAKVAGPSPFAAPALADDLAHMAPAHIVVAGRDPLRDDGVAFANRLALHAVPATLSRYDEMVHGFIQYTKWVEAGRVALEEGARFIHDAMEA